MTYHILSLSGGGIRGIFQALYLKNVELRLGRPLTTCFDLIAGTSTGAIIALGIALDVELNEIVDLFHKHGSEIFPPNVQKRSKRTSSWFCKGPIYRREPLQDTLVDVFGARRLKQSGARVVIAATTLDRYGLRVITTLNREDDNLLASDVVMASAAAPLYFPAFRPKGAERTYVDGGTWANNPSLLAVLEAHRLANIPFSDMRLISVGNGEIPSGVQAVDFNQMRRMRMLEPVLDMMFSTQSELADKGAACLLGDYAMTGTNMLRVNVTMQQFVALDDVEAAIAKLSPLAELAADDVTTGHGAFRKLVKAAP